MRRAEPDLAVHILCITVILAGFGWVLLALLVGSVDIIRFIVTHMTGSGG